MMTETWASKFAPGVTGRYSPRVDGEAQRWEARCAVCGVVYGPTKCWSGIVLKRMHWFALGHRLIPC